MYIDIVVEDGLSFRDCRHLELGVFLEVDLEPVAVVGLEKGPERPHQTEDVDLLVSRLVRVNHRLHVLLLLAFK